MKVEYSSFRDPSGEVFYSDGEVYRRISNEYKQQFDLLTASGFYEKCFKKKLLVHHSTCDNCESNYSYIIKAEKIPFISYPYEWSFNEIKDAAVLTLQLHLLALKNDFILKDASAYNVQFKQGNPIFIDTLSFDIYKEGEPWGAYGQFCRHFLVPLLLMKFVDISLNKMLKIYIDGIPLDIASTMLKGKGGFFVKQHIHWHAKAISKHSEDGKLNQVKTIKISKNNQIALVESILRYIEKMDIGMKETEWGDYYNRTNYTENAKNAKALFVEKCINEIDPHMVWDLGANDGTYSRLAIRDNTDVIAFDIDPVAVNKNYLQCKNKDISMLPLIMDLCNPSAGVGFAGKERKALLDRDLPDVVMALALIHHISISNNVPFVKLAEWLSDMSEYLIIEFVPKKDSQVKILLATREDIFVNYNEKGFEEAFAKYYSIIQKEELVDSGRTMYLMKRI